MPGNSCAGNGDEQPEKREQWQNMPTLMHNVLKAEDPDEENHTSDKTDIQATRTLGIFYPVPICGENSE